MALSVNGGGYGSRRRAGMTLSEINVTPFVDVVLVLLIIFMLTAHVLEYGIEVDVPKVRTVKDSVQELPVVTLTKDGTTMLGDAPTNINLLPQAITQKYGKAKAVYVRADKETVWEVLAGVVAELGQAGLQVNMVTQPEDTAIKKR